MKTVNDPIVDNEGEATGVVEDVAGVAFEVTEVKRTLASGAAT